MRTNWYYNEFIWIIVMIKKKLIAAISGGVDSAVAAAICQQRGYELIGVTLELKHPDPAVAGFQACTTDSDRESIAQLADRLNIKHYYLNLYPEFEKTVLRPAWDEYRRGRTPNPCTFCNPVIKFGQLLRFAAEQGAEGLVTGHYARIVHNGGIYEIRRGCDPVKDQSYFLYRLSQEQLSQTLFPLGEMQKSEVRKLAGELGLKNSEKKDSQDACFAVPGEVFAETLRRLFDGGSRPGELLYNGKTVGKHDGLHQFTIGQRKGLKVALGKPGYVQSIDPDSGKIILVTDSSELLAAAFILTDVCWQSGKTPELPHRCRVQVRYRSQPQDGVVRETESGLEIVLDNPARALTPGQAAVCYDDDLLLGGGIIERICQAGR
ncbi:MAG: tRNA 2-thiouridine(34) synthase MnmA [Victivallaceae bacterium]|nr:tRNA 2-thiouridine(34) synthase MnmA [Victivallaceae bacterium]